MKMPPLHHSPHPKPPAVSDPLPSDYPEDLISLDAQISQMAAEQNLPEGLTDRVFAASRVHLAASDDRTATIPDRLHRPHFGVRVLRTMWSGRLAMAASLAVAFLTTIMLMRLPLTKMETAIPATVLVSDLDWPDGEPVFIEDEVAYLFETEDLTSHDNLADDIQSILAELEM